MRCEEVTRELAAPSVPADPAALAAHLASCPACAARSDRAGRFDRLWAETRPADPSPAALDALWLRASAALDAPSAPALRLVGAGPVRARNKARRWLGVAVVASLVQAAAIVLITTNAIYHPRPRGPEAVAVAPASRPVAIPARLNVEEDQTVIVRLDDKGYRVDRLDDTPKGFSLADATPHDVIGAMESAAAQE